MAQRHLLPSLGKDCWCSSWMAPIPQLFAHYSNIIIVQHFCYPYSAWLLRVWALCPEVAFFATVETCFISSTCSVANLAINIHGIQILLRSGINGGGRGF